MTDPAFPDRIGIGDGPAVPCKVIGFDFTRDGATSVVGHRDENGIMYIDSWEASSEPGPTFTVEQARLTAERTGWYAYSMPPRPASHYLVDVSAPPNSCSRCGIEQRGHGEDHAYVTPDNVLRLARMKARRAKRLEPPRPAAISPDMIVESRVNTGAFTAAMVRAMEGLGEAARRAGEQMRTFTAAIGGPGDEEGWGEPLNDADANWPDDASRVCAHICGGDHECDARAATSLKYELPSGGTRSMPICGPCYTSETAAKENVDA